MHCWCVFGIGPHISDHGSLLRVAAYEACLSTYQWALISPWLKAVFTRHYSEWFNWSLLLLSVYSLKLDQTAECSYNAATCVKASLTVTLMDPLLLSAWHRALTYTHKTRKAPGSPAPGIFVGPVSQNCVWSCASVPITAAAAGWRAQQCRRKISQDACANRKWFDSWNQKRSVLEPCLCSNDRY